MALSLPLRIYYYDSRGVGGNQIGVYTVDPNSTTGKWYNAAYRTITFSTPATGNLLTWLQANAVKQQSGGNAEKRETPMNLSTVASTCSEITAMMTDTLLEG